MTLEEFRQQKDEYLKNDPDSPIPSQDRATFKGLKYYPPNPKLRFELAIDPKVDLAAVTLDTSTGEKRTYQRVGKVTFEVDGQPATLTIFGNWSGMFLLFRDRTSGGETYGAGRYLEPKRLPGGRIALDFNYAYNPYCVYAEHYSCPLPPRENWLAVPIEAGEKDYRD